MSMERIDKLFANLGYGSRSEARKWARNGRITMADGTVVKDVAAKVDPLLLRIDDEAIDEHEPIIILMHKPVGVVCSHSSADGARIYDLLPPRWAIRNPPFSTIGRLDKDTTGAILITDDTMLVHKLTAPKSRVPKTYRVKVDEVLDPAVLAQFDTGTLVMENEETPCLPAPWEIVSERVCRITIVEGRYHQVKRMFATIGYTVDKLHRESFAGLSADDIDLCGYRIVARDEIAGYENA